MGFPGRCFENSCCRFSVLDYRCCQAEDACKGPMLGILREFIGFADIAPQTIISPCEKFLHQTASKFVSGNYSLVLHILI